jgi:hypothetical protein
MTSSDVPVFIPFRLRVGSDTRRLRNLRQVMRWWSANGMLPILVSDGGQGDEPFNRHRAYNTAVEENPDLDVFVFSEADTLIHRDQILKAVDMALAMDGLVVPYTKHLYTSDRTAGFICRATESMEDYEVDEWFRLPSNDVRSVFDLRFERIMESGESVGAVNVVSRNTLNTTGGYTEMTSGNWYESTITEAAFAALTRKTRFVTGPAVHLYHLSSDDSEAAASNKKILATVRRMIRQGDRYGLRKVLAHREERVSEDV